MGAEMLISRIYDVEISTHDLLKEGVTCALAAVIEISAWEFPDENQARLQATYIGHIRGMVTSCTLRETVVR